MVNLVDYWAYQPNSYRKSALMTEMFSAASVSREREMTLLKRSSSLTHNLKVFPTGKVYEILPQVTRRKVATKL